VNTVALGTLIPEQMGNGSGIINLMRNVGGSIGVSTIVTMLARRSQVHQTTLVAHYTPYERAFVQAAHHVATHLPEADRMRGLRLMYGLLSKQAALLSYIDIFMWSVLLGVICTLLTFTLKRVKSQGPVMMH
jgi:DHA2 family multidrug resistance protein